MSKRKILALALTIAMIAILAVGGSLAYFTDTETATNVFTVGDVEIALHESNGEGAEDEAYTEWLATQTLKPNVNNDKKGDNVIPKIVTVENTGTNDAYMWIEVWVPSALDDGDDHSPAAPGLGNSLHFNYAANVVETKATYLGTKSIEGVPHNGYVHYVKGDSAKAKNASTSALLDQVYMDKDIIQGTNGYILMDGKTDYTGSWQLVINAIGIQADGFGSITDAISAYYEKDVTAHIW